MALLELHAEPRKVAGKKVRFLRREGAIPANVYSRNNSSLAIQIPLAELEELLSQNHTGGVIALKLTGEKHPRSVVLREVQRDALTGGLIHLNLQQVSMTEEVKVEILLVQVGEAKMTKANPGVVIQVVNSLMVKCVAKQIPDRIEADISRLSEPGQAIHVKDLNLGEGVTAMADPDEVVIKVVPVHVEAAEAKKPEEAAAAAAAEAGAAAPEGGAKAG